MTGATASANRRPYGSGPIGWLRRNGIVIFAGLATLYMLIPIAVIALFSFGDTPADRLTFDLSDGLTLKYWANAFGVAPINEALLTSIELAALATLGATILGTAMAIALVRYEFFGRKLSNLLIILPMASPEIVIGAALLSFFINSAIVPLGFATLLIAHIMFSISFVVVVVRSRLIGFDRRLEEAAADLGAGPWETFRLVTLPLIAPGVASAAALAFALSIDDFVISNFNSGTTETFPLYVYGADLRGIPVQVNVIATLLFAVAVVGIVFVIFQQRRAEKLAARRDEDDGAALAAG